MKNRWRIVPMGLIVSLTTGGCATMHAHPTACKVGSALAGATLGGVGGGVGVDQLGHHPDNGERAAGAAAGAVAGALVGTAIGWYACEPESPPPAPPPVAQAPPPARPAPGTKIATLQAAHFDFDKATLKPEGKTRVDEAIAVLQQNPTLRVSAEGHTDSVGSDEYNRRLGQRRAEAVKSYIVGAGIASSRIDVRTFGESRPIADNTTEAGRAQNRRVELIAE